MKDPAEFSLELYRLMHETIKDATADARAGGMTSQNIALCVIAACIRCQSLAIVGGNIETERWDPALSEALRITREQIAREVVLAAEKSAQEDPVILSSASIH